MYSSSVSSLIFHTMTAWQAVTSHAMPLVLVMQRCKLGDFCLASVQIHREESEWVAGLAARSFAPWIALLLSTIRPQALPVSATSLATLPQLTAGGGPAVRVRLLCLSMHPYALNPRLIGPLFDSD